jgi:hypothetical protein
MGHFLLLKTFYMMTLYALLFVYTTLIDRNLLWEEEGFTIHNILVVCTVQRKNPPQYRRMMIHTSGKPTQLNRFMHYDFVIAVAG